jgi:hypothetical protein
LSGQERHVLHQKRQQLYDDKTNHENPKNHLNDEPPEISEVMKQKISDDQNRDDSYEPLLQFPVHGEISRAAFSPHHKCADMRAEEPVLMS